jgi:hypothetical protein
VPYILMYRAAAEAFRGWVPPVHRMPCSVCLNPMSLARWSAAPNGGSGVRG